MVATAKATYMLVTCLLLSVSPSPCLFVAYYRRLQVSLLPAHPNVVQPSSLGEWITLATPEHISLLLSLSLSLPLSLNLVLRLNLVIYVVP